MSVILKKQESDKQLICGDGSRDIENHTLDQVENTEKCVSWKTVPEKYLCCVLSGKQK